MSWEVIPIGDTVHVIPLNDLRNHTKEIDCQCNPEVIHDGSGEVIVHNSWDKREVIEQALEIINKKTN